MTDRERQTADLRLTGTSTQGYPTVFVRAGLARAGVLTISEVVRRDSGERVRVAGVVTHRQRPGTAAGTVFLNLEDETGLLNVVCSAGMWKRYRRVGRRASALIVRGLVESADGVTALVADRLDALEGIASTGSRDWC
jgi:DNA polymerase III, alpha subunit